MLSALFLVYLRFFKHIRKRAIDLKVRFGGAATTAQRKEVQQRPVISALTSSPSNRNVRVHDNDRKICIDLLRPDPLFVCSL